MRQDDVQCTSCYPPPRPPGCQVEAFAIPDHILRAPIGLGGNGGGGPPPDIYREYLTAAGFEAVSAGAEGHVGGRTRCSELMTLGFVVFMAEALLSYQAPLHPGLARPERKRVHWVCNTVALCCCGLGLLAVLQSHRLKLPVPMADWYSPHSYLGLTALGLAAVQGRGRGRGQDLDQELGQDQGRVLLLKRGQTPAH
ncbi:hypothetical protein TSOC_013803 [Tetrabaena socialis]|uniref:Cytochrome b561 domain-containing protein n=1 Tax=Tetrabaena socialis TaxID=47790 RepID=A0A2J7ZJE0_9CHLO|nr:hypothetical protein TSOC_013803 [Tetrabaena socialis]|eukprot:PNH00376.1 hypothetical protein TSOC_013803 [Tetrabaena socialis]